MRPRFSPPAAALALVLMLAAITGSPGAPFLLNAQQATYATRPNYIRDHAAHIGSMPFDGLVVSSETGRHLMSGAVVGEEQVAREFAPLNGIEFARPKQLFALANVDRPADFFDDWTVTVANFRRFARMLRAHGFAGVFLDNEEYLRPLFNYPGDCSYPERTVREYQEQARVRGREIAQAMAAEFPELVLLVMHGPYSSFAGTPEAVRAGQTAWEAEEMRGAFSVGLIEGLDSRGQFVDGGELYRYRTETEFQQSALFRKTEIATPELACEFIPEHLRGIWSRKVAVGFGVYNQSYAGAAMSPAILRTTLGHAWRHGDGWVWLYAEGQNWNAPGEVGADWVQAVLQARLDAGVPGATEPWVELSTPQDAAITNTPATLTLEARAVSASASIRSVEFLDGTTVLGKVRRAPFRFTGSNPGPGVHRIRARATDSAGVESLSAPVEVVVAERFTAAINFQPDDVTVPTGFLQDSGGVFGARPSGLTYGWNEAHVENMRLRTADAELRRATLCQLRSGGAWEIAVPAGSYRVAVAIGDPAFESVHTLRVEGVVYWQARSLAAGEYLEQTATVNVTDGRLTIDQGDGAYEATRLAYVRIAAEDAAPVPPGALGLRVVGPGAVEVTWTDRSSTETAFVVERSTDPEFGAGVSRHLAPAGATRFEVTGLPGGVRSYFRVRAVRGEIESAPSEARGLVVPHPDVDSDGVADASETAPCIAGVDDRLVDSDGDGHSNAAEVLAGTLPLSGDSFPRLELALTRHESGARRVTWSFPAAAGRSYGVEFTDVIAAGVWTMCAGLPQIGQGTWLAGEEEVPTLSRIYRLRIYP